mgnify:CR=1 FL=1
MKRFNILLKGIIRENPTFVLILGMCPTLGTTTSAINGAGMGIATMFVLIMSNIVISLIKNLIPDKVRIPAFVLIIATFVTVVQMVLKKFMPDLYDSLGVFLPLIVVNCIILARAESFASHNKVGYSALDGLFMGLGFTAALTLMGAFREILGNGTFFGIKLWDFQIAFFSSAAGAFLTFGLFILIFNVIYNAANNRAKHKHALHENGSATEKSAQEA